MHQPIDTLYINASLHRVAIQCSAMINNLINCNIIHIAGVQYGDIQHGTIPSPSLFHSLTPITPPPLLSRYCLYVNLPSFAWRHDKNTMNYSHMECLQLSFDPRCFSGFPNYCNHSDRVGILGTSMVESMDGRLPLIIVRKKKQQHGKWFSFILNEFLNFWSTCWKRQDWSVNFTYSSNFKKAI